MAKIKSTGNGTKKEAIIEIAAKLFHEKGFSATSMRDLAEHVGVEAASLYNHIQFKSEILQEICFKVANDFTTNMENVDTSEQSAIGKVEALLRFHIKEMIYSYEGYTSVTGSGSTLRILTFPIIKTNVGSTARDLLTSLKTEFKKMK